MAKTTFIRQYSGRAEKPVDWDALLRIFDVIWGIEARSLPKYPKVINGVNAFWLDASGVRHEAESLDEVGQAYQKEETAFIYFTGSLNNSPYCKFFYRPSNAQVSIDIEAKDLLIANKILSRVRMEFPLIIKYLFVSYDTAEIMLANYIKKVLKKRLAPGISVFVAKHDITPGANPLKVMLEEQLRHAEALIALCSQKSRISPWLWWESSAVWARGGLVIPLFINISPKEFDGPLTLVCQGGDFFDVAYLNSALIALNDKVCPGNQCENLSKKEIIELNKIKSLILSESRLTIALRWILFHLRRGILHYSEPL